MTDREYWDKVAALVRLNAAEPLLQSLHTGHTRVTEAYLSLAWKRIPKEEDEPDEVEGAPEDEYVADETMRELWRRRTELFGEMNKLSNKFHDCKTDAQRRLNSELIMSIWSQITRVKAQIAQYKETGELYDQPGAAEMPENPVALGKKLNSLRSQRSQLKKKILDIAGLDEGTPGKQSDINKLEDDIKKLTFQIGIAEQRLQELSND